MLCPSCRNVLLRFPLGLPHLPAGSQDTPFSSFFLQLSVPGHGFRALGSPCWWWLSPLHRHTTHRHTDPDHTPLGSWGPEDPTGCGLPSDLGASQKPSSVLSGLLSSSGFLLILTPAPRGPSSHRTPTPPPRAQARLLQEEIYEPGPQLLPGSCMRPQLGLLGFRGSTELCAADRHQSLLTSNREGSGGSWGPRSGPSPTGGSPGSGPPEGQAGVLLCLTRS